MHFRDRLKKEAGRTLTLEDMVSHNTTIAQIQLLTDQHPRPNRNQPSWSRERTGPPSVADIVHTHGEAIQAESTQNLVEKVINPLGLSWDNDVEDVTPAYDLAQVLFQHRRRLTWNFRYALVTNADHSRVRMHSSIGSRMLTKTV